MEEKLATLKESLVDIEKHLCDESRHVDEQSIFYDQSLSTTAAMARSLIHPSADDNDGKREATYMMEKEILTFVFS